MADYSIVEQTCSCAVCGTAFQIRARLTGPGWSTTASASCPNCGAERKVQFTGRPTHNIIIQEGQNKFPLMGGKKKE